MTAFPELSQVLLGCTAVAQALEQNLFHKHVVSVLRVKNLNKTTQNYQTQEKSFFGTSAAAESQDFPIDNGEVVTIPLLALVDSPAFAFSFYAVTAVTSKHFFRVRGQLGLKSQRSALYVFELPLPTDRLLVKVI